MKLRISDVAKILDLPLETLRFYERNNVVTPLRDENNYRYYDTWNVFDILELLHYRNTGFSVKEAAEAMHFKNADEITDLYVRNIERMRSKMEYDNMIMNHLERNLSELKTIERNIGLFRYEMRKEQKGIFFSFEEEEEYPGMNPGNTEITKWLKAMPFTKGVKHIVVDDELNITESSRWSFMIEGGYADYFGLLDSKDVFTVPAGLYLTVYVVAGAKGEIGDDLFIPVIDFIKKNDLKVDGEILSVIVMKGHDNDNNLRRYIKVAVPIGN